MKKIKVTEEKYKNLKEDLESLKKKRNSLNRSWELAVNEGDARETDALSVTITLLEDTEREIIKLTNLLDDVELIDRDVNSEKVRIGSKVIVKINSIEETIHIVDPIEAEPTQNKYSFQSPLGQSLIGKKAGEQVSYPAPGGGKIGVLILSIK